MFAARARTADSDFLQSPSVTRTFGTLLCHEHRPMGGPAPSVRERSEGSKPSGTPSPTAITVFNSSISTCSTPAQNRSHNVEDVTHEEETGRLALHASSTAAAR